MLGKLTASRPASKQDVRHLGPIEKHLLRFASGFGGAMKVGVLLQLEQPIVLERLDDALCKMEGRHPNARYTIRDSKSICETAGGSQPVTQISVYKRSNSETWLAVWDEVQVKTPKIGQSGLQIAVINGDSEAELLLAGDHFMCDGVSLMQFAHELLQAIADSELEWEPKEWAVPMKKCMKKTVTSRWSRKAAVAKYLYRAVVTDNRPKYRARVMTKAPVVNRDSYAVPCKLSSFSVSADEVALLVNFAKAHHNATMNSVVMSASLRAMADVIDPHTPSNINLAMAVNARPRYTGLAKPVEATDLGYHSTGFNIRGKLGGDALDAKALWDDVRRIHDDVQSALRRPAYVFEAFLAAPLAWKALPIDDAAPTAIISNWGRTPFFEHYGGAVGKLNGMQALINMNMYSCPYIVFSSTNGSLEVNVIGTQRYLNQEQIKSVSQAVKRTLNVMVAYARESKPVSETEKVQSLNVV